MLPPAPQGAAPAAGEAALKVPAFKSVKEAEAWAVTNDLVDHADFSGAKIEVVTEWLQSLADHVREFPALRQNQKFVGTCQAQISRWRKLEIEDMVAKLKAANPDRTDDFTKFAERYVPNKKVSGQTWAFSWSQKNVSGVAVNKRWAASRKRSRTPCAATSKPSSTRLVAIRSGASSTTSWDTSWTSCWACALTRKS
jgi:hypothetical protein